MLIDKLRVMRTVLLVLAGLFVLPFAIAQWPERTSAAEPQDAGHKTQWHGYDQHHFAIGERKAYIVVPKKAAIRNPWVWRARFPDYHAEMDVTLLEQGFHIAYLDVAGLYGDPKAVEAGNQFYATVMSKYHLSPKVVLEGVSRGGLFIYNWAAQNLDKVACIYADTPVMDFKSWPGGKGTGIGSATSWQQCLEAYGLTEQEALAYHKNPIDHVEAIVRAGIPILHIVSETDRVVPPAENTRLAFERVPEKLRRNFRIMSVAKGTAESNGHHFKHPNPAAVVRFVIQHAIFEGGYVSSGVSRTLEQIDGTYATMPPLKYQPPANRWKFLPRTIEGLRSGGTLRVVMLGDSIVNDTSRSQWHLLLQCARPGAKITKITSVRGSTGCWWYKDNQRVQVYVLDQKPGLVIIGGISQRDDIDAIREVVRQIRAGSQAEVLLMSGAFGRVDPRDDTQWQLDFDPTGKSYRARLKRLADELKVEFLDMRGPWGQYIRQSGKDLDWFHRDPVHANERGEQIIGRILYRYLAPDS